MAYCIVTETYVIIWLQSDVLVRNTRNQGWSLSNLIIFFQRELGNQIFDHVMR